MAPDSATVVTSAVLSSTIRRLVRNTSGWIYPDRFVIWRTAAGVALRKCHGARACMVSRPNAVLASFPPASAALLGTDLARRWRVPLALDYRDLWSGPGGYHPPTALHRALHRRLQRRIANRAAALIAVSIPMADALAESLRFSRDRIAVIPNGFDAQRCPLPAAEDAAEQAAQGITLAHIGMVIPRNRPDLFFAAIDQASDATRAAWREQSLRILFVGNLSADMVHRKHCAGLVDTTGLIPHEAAWREALSASALLLLVGEYVGRWGHNAKLFEYLRAGRPILCLEECAGSNDRRLLEQLASERCVFASLRDPEAVVAGINAIAALARQLGGRRLPPPPELNAFDRVVTCGRLAELLHSMTY